MGKHRASIHRAQVRTLGENLAFGSIERLHYCIFAQHWFALHVASIANIISCNLRTTA
jgi:hypothetical protein